MLQALLIAICMLDIQLVVTHLIFRVGITFVERLFHIRTVNQTNRKGRCEIRIFIVRTRLLDSVTERFRFSVLRCRNYDFEYISVHTADQVLFLRFLCGSDLQRS